MINNYDKEWNKILFSLSFFNGISDEEKDKRWNLAESVIKVFGDQTVFDEWFNYLNEFVNNQNDAWSFMLWFFDYTGGKLKVKDPYPFLALLFKKLELSIDKDKGDKNYDYMLETFDSIYAQLLLGAGIIKVEDYCYVNFFNDSKFKEELDAIKN